jgi:hypothetical protein
MLRSAEAPRWLGRLALAALALFSLGVVVGPLAVLGGAWIGEAHEAPLRTVEPPSPAELAPGEQVTFGAPLTFDSALTVEAQFDSGADPLAWWGVVCQAADGATLTYRLTADGYFSVLPLAPESRAFLHIRPPGQPNRLMLLRSGAHLRINEEIAWDGALPPLRTCQLAAGSVTGPARLVVLGISAR